MTQSYISSLDCSHNTYICSTAPFKCVSKISSWSSSHLPNCCCFAINSNCILVPRPKTLEPFLTTLFCSAYLSPCSPSPPSDTSKLVANIVSSFFKVYLDPATSHYFLVQVTISHLSYCSSLLCGLLVSSFASPFPLVFFSCRNQS